MQVLYLNFLRFLQSKSLRHCHSLLASPTRSFLQLHASVRAPDVRTGENLIFSSNPVIFVRVGLLSRRALRQRHLPALCCAVHSTGGNNLTYSLNTQSRAHVLVDELCKRSSGDISIHEYVFVLQECIRSKALEEGQRVHDHVLRSGLERNENVGTNLVRLYSRCGRMVEARKIFDMTLRKDLFMLTALLKGYVDSGRGDIALALFHELRGSDVRLDKFVYAIIVNVCASAADLSAGRRVHARMVEEKVQADVLLNNCLLSLYVKCGSPDDAVQVFEGMPQRDVISWNTIIGGLNEHGRGGSDALKLFKRMLKEGPSPDVVTLICTLNACASIQALEEGRMVHSLALSVGLDGNVLLNNAVVDMYAKCMSLLDARRVFDSMPTRDTVSWNAMIQGYAQHGLVEEAFDLLKQMQYCSGKPDVITFIHLLKACISSASLEKSKCLHGFIERSGLESDVFISSSLIHMYAKSGSLCDALRVFDHIRSRNVVSWTTMITAYAQAGLGEEALSLYGEMQLEMQPNSVTFVSALQACALVRAIDKGRTIHKAIIQSAAVLDVVLETALVDMYSKCGSVDEARSVFDKMSSRNVVSWNAMIACCAQNGSEEVSLELFQQMQQEGVEPDMVTFVSVLNACSGIGALKVGKIVHSSIISRGYELDCIVGNALVDMYAKCQSLESARQVFDNMHVRDVVSWNALFKGYIQHGRAEEGVKLLRQMQHEAVKPDVVTYVTLLNGCASMEALVEGREIHGCLTRSGLDRELFIGNALIDMYAKCGSIEDAREVFDAMMERDMVSWSSMVSGYAQHGFSIESLELFKTMLEKSVPMDSITFLGVLSACSRVGLVDKGLEYFSSMTKEHGITPSDAHYACLVDLLGRAGRLGEAANLIKTILGQPSVSLWTSLLASCRLHGNVVLAEEAAGHILDLEPQNSAAFVLLANTYAAAGMWQAKLQTWQLMKDRGVRKQPGRSWININNEVHAFMVEDKSHSVTNKIYAEMKRLSRLLESKASASDIP